MSEILNIQHATITPHEPSTTAETNSDVLKRGVVIRAAQLHDQPLRYEVRVGEEIRVGERRVLAGQAESCVLRPEPDDVVLVSLSEEEPSYILAVLERAVDKPRRWQPPRAGSLELAADRLALSGAQQLSVRAPLIDLTAAKTKVISRTLDLVGEAVSAASDKLEWVGKRLQTVSEWSAHRTGSYFRSVEQADNVKATHIIRRAEETYTAKSTHTILTAKHDVRIDGERIHVG